MVRYIRYHGKEPWDNVTGGRVESMCRLTHVIPSMLIKDHIIEGSLVILNACLSISWSDNSFLPRSQVAQLRPGLILSKCAHWR